MTEVWKTIKDFPHYQISNEGRLKIEEYYTTDKRGQKRKVKGHIFSLKNKYGWYLTIILRDIGKRKTCRIHHLVYEAFKGAIPKGFVVHHKDGNKQNNRVSNLELLTAKEHIHKHLRINPLRSLRGMVEYNKFKRPKTVMQFTLDGIFVHSYPNAKQAFRETGVCSRNILQVASHTPFNKNGDVRKQAGGYIWRFKE